MNCKQFIKPEIAIRSGNSSGDFGLNSHQVGDQLGLQKGKVLPMPENRGIERPLGVATYQLQEVVDRTVAELEQKAKEKE